MSRSPFDYKTTPGAIDWVQQDKDARRGRALTKHVERQRAKGIEPMRIGLKNQNPPLKKK